MLNAMLQLFLATYNTVNSKLTYPMMDMVIRFLEKRGGYEDYVLAYKATRRVMLQNDWSPAEFTRYHTAWVLRAVIQELKLQHKLSEDTRFEIANSAAKYDVYMEMVVKSLVDNHLATAVGN